MSRFLQKKLFIIKAKSFILFFIFVFHSAKALPAKDSLQWSIGVHYTYLYNFLTIKTDYSNYMFNPGYIEQYFVESIKSTYSSKIGLFFLRNMSNHFSIAIEPTLTKLTYFSSEISKTPNGGFIFYNKQYKNVYSLFDIPFIIRYNKLFYNTSIYLGAGMGYSIYTSYQNTALTYKSNNFFSIVCIGVRQIIIKRLSFFLEPNFTYYFQPVNPEIYGEDKKVVTIYFYPIGIRGGIGFNF